MNDKLKEIPDKPSIVISFFIYDKNVYYYITTESKNEEKGDDFQLEILVNYLKGLKNHLETYLLWLVNHEDEYKILNESNHYMLI
jgi:hypothetical protein